MKNLNSIIIIIITLLLVSILGCSSSSTANPSQNSALNSVTSSGKNTKTGSMQNALDSWLEKEWTPTVEKDKEIKEKNSDQSRDFTLQEYVDKATLYIKENNNTYENSHSKKISSMPVIGK